MPERRTAIVVVLVLLVGVATSRALAAPGDLDPTFGLGGTGIAFITAYADHPATDGVLQPDGRMVLVGASRSGNGPRAITVVRLLTDGSLDATFGTGGIVTTPLGDGTHEAEAVALQPDGRILVAGETDRSLGTFAEGDFVVLRYLSDGSLDPSFGVGGVVQTAFGPQVDHASAIVVQPNGKIVVAGTVVTGGAQRFGLARYEADGSLDLTFGVGGRVVTALRASDGINALALQPDGKLVAGGTSSTFVNTALWDFALARYDPDGSLDASFGTGGVVIASLGGSTHTILDVLVQPDGKLVAAGSVADGGHDVVALRLDASGTLDPGFGSGGFLVTDIAGAYAAVASVLQPDGRLVLGGYRSTALTIFDFLLLRVDGTTGGLDAGFGSGGAVVTIVDDDEADTVCAVRRQTDGKLVAMGVKLSGAVQYLPVVARYEGTPAACGNGVPEPPESCDDGNVAPGDGCSGACGIEPGFSCSAIPSACTAGCGDGAVTGSETCDDGGTSAGDGCDATCQVEAGWTCAGGPSSCAAVCGDSRVVGGEQCDDGNMSGGDCCTSLCQFEVAGSVCLDEGNPCSADVCGASGVCQHQFTPAAVCLLPVEPARAHLKIALGGSANAQVQFKWTKGPVIPKTSFGTPSADTPRYALCVYDESGGTPSSVLHAVADGDADCADRACWKETSTAWTLKNKDGAPDGVVALKLREGLVAGKSKVQVKLKGAQLAAPSLPLTSDSRVVAQVRTTDGQCFGAAFSTPTRNDGVAYRAKSD